MNDVTTVEPKIDQIARFQSLQPGQYWRALKTIVEEGIEEGTVLLIQSIRWVDDAPHTIILRPHPTKIGMQVQLDIPREDGTTRQKWFRYDEHRFLLSDFLASFEFEAEHQRIRSDELQQIQGKINSLQGELIEAQSNPALLAGVVNEEMAGQRVEEIESDDHEDGARMLPVVPAAQVEEMVSLATGTVANAIGAGITAERIEQMKEAASREHQVATIKSKWIQKKTSEIAATIKAMTPFYEEQAAAALAQTEDVRTYVAKLMQGIESLDLYIGKNVEVDTIRNGEPAARDVPLTFVQKKLMMDEELAVWTDVDHWFDFEREDKFFEALRAHDSLVNQIFPTERCVLVMAVTRRAIDYGDKYANITRNDQNKKVFLMVRDGMNLHRVFSPVESHLGAACLFPSKDDQDAVFRGMDGSQIKFEDVAYTDKLAAHERFALHYKRFLLLVCGLDHRLKLFGDFYEGPHSLHFVSMSFQERYCRFLHDDDGSGLLPGEQRQPLKQWITDKNAFLRSGSRVLCKWNEVMNPSTAPGACKAEPGRHSFHRRYDPKNDMDIVIAYKEGNAVCVDVEVSGRTYEYEDRNFNCKVNLSKIDDGKWDYTDLPYLCLDAVRPEELDWYIHNRDTRRDHLSYIRFFKRALKFVTQELEAEGDTRQRMMQALADGAIATGKEAESLVDQAVVAWRAANRGKPLPQFLGNAAPAAWKSLLDQMYVLAGNGRRQADDVAAFVRSLGYEPLRLVLSGKAKLVVYAAPRPDERDDRVVPHAWVHRVSLERGKAGYLEKSRRWALLPKSAASETTLHQWEGEEAWPSESEPFPSFERKQEILGLATRFMERLQPFAAEMAPEDFLLCLQRWESLRRELLRGSKYVQNPYLAVPFGVVYYPYHKTLRYLCVGTYTPHGLLHRLAPDDLTRERIRSKFISPYANESSATKEFASAIEQPGWCLMEVDLSLAQGNYGAFFHRQIGVSSERGSRQHPTNPLLAHWFERWHADLAKRNKVWLADGTMSDEGKLVLDELLGITLPDGFDPVSVTESRLTVRSRDEAALPVLNRWYDICREGIEPPDPKDGNYGWSRQTFYACSPDKARDFIKQRAEEALEGGCRVVRSTDLADTPVQPEGVERWYVLPAA